jgi:hypothetical protein
MCKGIEVFTKNVGKPDVIVFQIFLWDVVLKEQGVPEKNISAAYKSNILLRLEDVKRCKDPETLIYLRTAPWNSRGGRLLGELNEIVRSISVETGLPLFDFDVFLWGWREHTVQEERAIFRDVVHPKDHLCAHFGLYVMDHVARLVRTRRFTSQALAPPARDDSTVTSLLSKVHNGR